MPALYEKKNTARVPKIAVAVLLGAVAMLGGCVTRLDMHDQPKYRPLRESDFFADKRSARPILAGTVARGQLQQDSYFYTGKIGNTNTYGTEFPVQVNQQMVERGRERFNIYCAPCHSRVGDGNGMIAQRGLKNPPSLHTDRLRKAPVGHFFDVITNGFGAMGDYREQIAAGDRWAIVAYVRALQLSQNATRADVPAGMQVSNQPPDLTVSPERPTSSQQGTHGEAVKQGGESPEKQ